MDKVMMTDKKFSEFNYSEDAQMALDDALYANDFSLDGVKEFAIDSAVKVLFVPLLNVAAPSTKIYAESNVPEIEQRDIQKTMGDIQESQDPIIDDSAVSEESPYNLIKSFVKNLTTLPKDLPGLDFVVPSKEITDNTLHFLNAMEDAGLPCPEMGSVMPSVFGTFVIDAMVERGLVSIEIGRTKVGFFTDYEDGINEESDGIVTNFETIPEVLLNHLKG